MGTGVRSVRVVARSGASVSSRFVTARCTAFFSLIVGGALHPVFRGSNGSVIP
jgi:hypothetical protein